MSNTQSSSKDKATIYVDVDDEITSIIDKVRSSDGKVVALVLPKRATVLQSIVNMKLLKRTAENAKKHLVLVTTEAGLLPLAGSVGLHVAATATSKPAIPKAPEALSNEAEDLDETIDVQDTATDDDFDPDAEGAKTVGELAGASAAAGVASTAGRKTTPAIDEEIDIDDDASADGASDGAAKAAKPKKNKKLAIPNFDNFRTKLLIGFGVLALLIVGWVFAFVILPKATITVHTDTTDVATNVNLTLDTATKTLDIADNIVPATAQTTEKSYTQQVPTTGQVNNGQKAEGSVKFTAKKCSGAIGIAPTDVAAGTGITGGGRTYVTQDNMSFNFTGFSNGGTCANYTSGTIDIVAQAAGTIFNTGSTAFTVGGRADIAGTGDAEGGTDAITKVVAQADIDSAKSKISTQDTSAVRSGLQATLQGKQVTPIPSTFIAGEPIVTTSAKVGDPADAVTVTEVIAYTMLGAKQADLKAIVVNNVNKEIDPKKQVILDDGLKSAKFTQANAGSPTAASVAMAVKSTAGPDIDVDSLVSQVMGKKSGEIKSTLEQIPGVTSVEVKYSPFWVHTTPKNEKKITIQLDKSNTGKQ